MTNLPILAEDAAEIAPAKENGAGAPAPGDRPLLAMVWSDAADHSPLAGPAAGPFGIGDPVYPTAIGAEIAFGQPSQGLSTGFRPGSPSWGERYGEVLKGEPRLWPNLKKVNRIQTGG